MLGLTLISTSNHLWLEFYSNEESTGEGFKLVYSSKYTCLTSINLLQSQPLVMISQCHM